MWVTEEGGDVYLNEICNVCKSVRVVAPQHCCQSCKGLIYSSAPEAQCSITRPPLCASPPTMES